MIPFFRKIRKKMADDNKPMKYMRYAIGEIVLVMIGILLALQVNNWNINRNNTKQEVALLSQLENEYEENLNEVNEKIEMRFAILSSIKELFYYIDKGIDGVHLDTITKHISRTFGIPTFNGPNGVTTELLNSGKLYLIKNSELKIQLSNWKNTVQKVVEEEQLLLNQNSNFYFEYLNQNYNLMKMGGNGVKDEVMDVFYLSEENRVDSFRITGENDEAEFRKYLSDETISNYLLWNIAYCSNANIQAVGLKNKIERILEIISDELKNI